MKTYAVLVERVQISTYYVDANTEVEAKCKAEDQANNDDWSRDQAYYLTEISEVRNLPF